MPHGNISILIRNVSGTQVGIMAGEAERLRWSTSAPGGCLECSFVLPRKARLWYPDIGYSFEVLLADGAGVFWRGFMERIRPAFLPDSEGLEITALGGGVNADDQHIVTETFALGVSIQAAVSTIRTTYMPKVTTESLVATGRTLNAAVTITDKPAREGLNALCRLGTSADVPLYWYVWPDGAANAYQLVLAARPSVEDYRVSIGDIDLTFGFDGQNYGNRVRVLYNAGATWTMVEDAAAQTAVNRIRERVIRVPHITNATDAANVGNTLLVGVKQLRASAESGTITVPWAVRDSNRQIVELQRVRAGKLLYVQGLEPTSGQAGALDWHNTMLIVGTDYDYEAGALQLRFERFDSLLEGVITRLSQEAGL